MSVFDPPPAERPPYPSARAILVSSFGKDGDVAADAQRLIATFHDQAYYEARDRARARCIDGAGSARSPVPGQAGDCQAPTHCESVSLAPNAGLTSRPCST